MSSCKHFIPVATDGPYSDPEQHECGLKIAVHNAAGDPGETLNLNGIGSTFSETFAHRVNP